MFKRYLLSSISLLAIAFFFLGGCSDSGGSKSESNTPITTPDQGPADQTVKFNFSFSSFRSQILKSENKRTENQRSEQAFTVNDIMKGTLTVKSTEDPSAEAQKHFWTIYADKETYDMKSNGTLTLKPGEYSFSLLVENADQQYVGSAIYEIKDGTNDVPMTVRPVIGDTLGTVEEIERLANFRFNYDDFIFTYQEPKIGIIVDNGDENIFALDASQDIEGKYLNLEKGSHNIRLKLYDGEEQVGKSNPFKENVEVVPGQALIMDLISLHGETVLTLTEDGGEGTFKFKVDREIIDEAGGVGNLKALITLKSKNNPLQEAVLTFSNDVSNDGYYYSDPVVFETLHYDTGANLYIGFTDIAEKDLLGYCSKTFDIDVHTKTLNCDALVLQRRSIITGQFLATLGLNVYTQAGEPVKGATIFANGQQVGITGSGAFGTIGYLRSFLATGDYRIEARFENQHGEKTINLKKMGVDNIHIFLEPVVLESIDITPNDATVALGLEENYKASGNYSDKTSKDITSLVQWSSSDTTIATIGNAEGVFGKVSTLSEGNSDISATLDGISATTTLKVGPPVLVSVVITPELPSIGVGAVQNYKATAVYSDKREVDVTESSSWSSSDVQTVSVVDQAGNKGKVTGVALGTAQINVTYNGVTGTHTTKVREPDAVSETYSSDLDFGQGTLVNVAPNNEGSLTMAGEATAFNFIWLAVSSKGTVVKINTDTGEVLGEYLTSPIGIGSTSNPSRTTVDHNGAVWVGNRGINDSVNGKAMGSVVHIGLEENGGCVDRNGNGVIDTSKKLGDVRGWNNANNVNTNGGVSGAADECIIHYTRVNSTGTRHVSVDSNNNVWIGGYTIKAWDLLDGNTGQIIRSEPSVGYGGYGGLIDGNGVIWSARPFFRWDPAKPLTGANGNGPGTGANWFGYDNATVDSYGMCIDSQGNVWNTELQGGHVRKYDPAGNLLGRYSHGGKRAQGCTVDKNDHVWVAHALDVGVTTVGHLLNNGTYVGTVNGVGEGPSGIAVDGAGKIWTASYRSGTATRIDPNAGPLVNGVHVGQVDFQTGNLGGNLYNYSDMTGSTLHGAPKIGTWTLVHDSSADGIEWEKISWSATVIGDSTLTMFVSSSNDDQSYSAPEEATSGGQLSVPAGRYLKVEARFNRGTTDTDQDGTKDAALLNDLTVTPILR